MVIEDTDSQKIKHGDFIFCIIGSRFDKGVIFPNVIKQSIRLLMFVISIYAN